MPGVDASGADYMAFTAKHTGFELWEHIFFAPALKAEQHLSQIEISKTPAVQLAAQDPHDIHLMASGSTAHNSSNRLMSASSISIVELGVRLYPKSIIKPFV